MLLVLFYEAAFQAQTILFCLQALLLMHLVYMALIDPRVCVFFLKSYSSESELQDS